MARRRGVRETVVGRAERLPFADGTFDVVSMSYMLRHVEDLSLAFTEAHRVLRPGGRIVIRPIPAHGDIAARVSATRETVARALSDLAKKGIVAREKQELVVRDPKRLKTMVSSFSEA
jgi:ubiquinone/menaquinone biosynthesis C-methylase UbiE